jgi:hypothetical protein
MELELGSGGVLVWIGDVAVRWMWVSSTGIRDVVSLYPTRLGTGASFIGWEYLEARGQLCSRAVAHLVGTICIDVGWLCSAA